MRNIFSIISILLAALWLPVLSSCEKGYVGADEGETEKAQSGNITLHVASVETIDFSNVASSNSSTELASLFTRLQFAVFQDGSRQALVSQQSTDADFGKATLTLAEGTYQLVVMGHNCTGNATITDLAKITFPNNKVTDTFYYYGVITVGSDAKTIDVELKRAVSMFRVSLPEALPDSVAQLKFYYTGGSSTFSATAGYGSVNSKQTEIRDVAAGQKVFEVYTFPHEAQDVLKMTITALDAAGNELYQCTLDSVSVEINKITVYSGDLFNTSAKSSATAITVKGNGEWDGIIEM